jgi:DNA invertase Pin-like site-specific DNA recombinase
MSCCNPVAPLHRWRHHYLMVSGRTRPTEADLFSTASLREPSSPSANPTKDAATSPRYLLPGDLAGGIRQLPDQEFDRLLAAVLAEQRRRGRKLPVSPNTSRQPQIEEVALPLTFAKLNAIRAAFKAGVAPSRIARQFGISQSDVRKALAKHQSKRAPSRD